MENKYEYYTFLKLTHNYNTFYAFTGPHNIIKDQTGENLVFIQLTTNQTKPLFDSRILDFLFSFMITTNKEFGLFNNYNLNKLIEKLKAKGPWNKSLILIKEGIYLDSYVGINMPYSTNKIKLAFLKFKPNEIIQSEMSILDNDQINRIIEKINTNGSK